MLRISILLGLMFVIFLIGRIFWIRRTTPPPKPVIEYAKVVIASVDIPAHTVITGAMLREERRLPKEVPEGSFARIDDVINRVAKVDIFAGTPVMRSDVTQPLSQEGLGALIPEGYVAVALPIDNEALYRMLRTGDHVRIIASFGGLLSQTIVEDAVVLGVDTKVMNVELSMRGQPPQAAQQQVQQEQQAQQPSPLRTLLLLVRPEEAERIALVSAQTNVRIEFSLLSSRPPVPTPVPKAPQKRPTMASDIHPAVERIAAKGAGMALEDLDKVFGRARQPTLPVPQLPPVDPAQIAANVHGKLLSDLAPQVRSIHEEQERLRQEMHAMRRVVTNAVTDAQLKQLMVEVNERLKNVEKEIESMKAKPLEVVTPTPPEQKETVTIFLGTQSIRAPVGQPVEAAPLRQ
ncbi:MAG: Flp pilus assembly protein CpaB [Armatimonadota bacterium]|nr:Flp pilus assembly protein CpaB [Armatimonadota bacterium]MCX7777690.1 Flp pilus assembly protein CpaB [Armatimonadota bacterium]MDW8025449.1 Flp pilus assembly protein CpaB [Armatimonadota bacterium]